MAQQPAPQEQYLYDGQTTFVGGQDASKIPAQVDPDAYFAAINVSVADGVLAPRWGVNHLTLTLPPGGIVLPNSLALVPYSEIFYAGRYQCGIPYSIGNDYYLIVVISGIIFLINQRTLITIVLPIQGGGSLNENTTRLNWSQAGRFVVIFDYPNFPVIIEGLTARRADPAKFEVPVSVGGAYNQNRLFIYNAGNDLTAGDPTGSLATPDAPITFEEVELPAAPFVGQIFELPTDKRDNITAFAFLQLNDTSTGIGPLLVATANQIFSYQSQLPRTQWEVNQFGSMFVDNAGIVGSRAWTNVNSDIFFLSADGQVRTASMSRQEQGKWSRIPLSREVQNWLKYNDKTLAKYSVMAYFNNKIFISANPYRTNALDTQRQPVFDFAFGGFVVLGLENISVLGKNSSLTLGHEYATPEWDGLWTGVRPMDIIQNNNRCFIISKDDDVRNEIYELDPTSTVDTDGADIRYATAIIYTREFDFKSPFNNKDLHSLDLGLREVQGDFSIDVKYKPSHGSAFIDWGSFDHCAPWRTCGVPDPIDFNGFAPHNFRDLTIGSPADQGCDPVSKLTYDTFRRVQLKFIIEGKYWQLQEFRLKSIVRPQSEQVNGVCLPPNDCVKVPKECTSTDWAIGPFKSCLTHQT